MANNLVHVAAANSYYRRAARLTFQRHKPKRFLNTRVDEEIGRSIITREISGIGAILNPGEIFPVIAGVKLSKFLALRPVADDQQVKFT